MVEEYGLGERSCNRWKRRVVKSIVGWKELVRERKRDSSVGRTHLDLLGSVGSYLKPPINSVSSKFSLEMKSPNNLNIKKYCT